MGGEILTLQAGMFSSVFRYFYNFVEHENTNMRNASLLQLQF